jgi:hypothetical protein
LRLNSAAVTGVWLAVGALVCSAQTPVVVLDLDLAAGAQGVVSTPEAKAGDTITLQLTLLADPGPFSQLEVDLAYDARALTPVSSRAIGRYANAITVVPSGSVSDSGVKFSYAILGGTIQGPTDLMEIDFRVEEGFAGQAEVVLVQLSIGPNLTDRQVFTPANARILVGQTPTATAIDEVTPARFELQPNYPNPFNAETVIGYSIDRAELGDLTIFDLLGQRVRRLVSGRLAAGTHAVRWDARDDGGRQVSTGVYVVRLQAGERAESYKATVLK